MVSEEKFPIYVSRIEASLRLKCSVRKIDRLIRDSRIKSFKVERTVLIYLDSLTEEYINSTKPKFLK